MEIYLKKVNNNYIYVLLSLLFFFGSLKSPNLNDLISEDSDLSYSVPLFIKTLMTFNNVIVGIIIFFSIVIYFGINNNIFNTGSIEAKFILIFYLVLIFTELILFNEIQRFSLSIILLFSLYIYFNHVLNNLVFYSKNEKSIIKSIFFGGYMFLMMNFIIHFFGFGNMLWKGRFFGLASHPNFLGLIAAIICLISFFLLVQEKNKKIIYFSGFLLSGYMIYLSDSRTALVSSIIGLIYLIKSILSHKIFESVMALLIVLIFSYFIIFVDIDSIFIGERGNSRSKTWTILFEEILKFPVFGKGRGSVGATTNSIMYAIVASGFLGAFFFILAIARKIGFCYFLKENSVQKIYLTLMLTLMVMSIAEGFLIENIGFLVFLFWILISAKKNKLVMNI